MKKITLTFVFIISCIPYTYAQLDDFYYYKGEKIQLQVDSTRYLIISEGELSLDKSITDFLTDGKYKSNRLVNPIKGLSKEKIKNIFVSEISLLAPHKEAYLKIDNSIKKISNVIKILPAFTINNKKIGVTNNFYVKLLMAEYDKRDVGLVAQEVEKVLPDIVYSVNSDKKGIAYTQLIALLIEGVKEQQKQINTLNETVATLQGISETKPLSFGSPSLVTSINAQAKTEAPLLEQNAPNPFNVQTQIGYYLPSKVNDAQLRIYNLSGHQLRCIKLTERGRGNITIMANDLESGIYLYSLIVDGTEVSCKRMILTD